MRLVTYCRSGSWSELAVSEQDALRRHTTVVDDLARLQPGDVVLPRFSRLPFSADLDATVRAAGARLLNDDNAYRYIADLRCWQPDLGDLTPRSWPADTLPPVPGPYVVKGETNSRKHLWDTHCYAADATALAAVVRRLRTDPLLSQQELLVREFVPLHNVGVSTTGIPVSEEYRCFLRDGQLLAAGFYWQDQPLRDGFEPAPQDIPAALLADVHARLTVNMDWVVADVARTAAGDWTVIELNEPSLTGLAGVPADILYRNLAASVTD